MIHAVQAAAHHENRSEKVTLMRLGRTTLALAVFFGLTSAASAAQKGTKALSVKAKQQHLHHVHGVVVSVEHDTMKGHGTIKVKVQQKHPKKAAKTAAAAATSKKKRHDGMMTFKVGQLTKFDEVIHSQGRVQRQKARFADVRPGESVRVAFNSQHDALEVEVIVHRAKKLTPATPPAKKPPLKKPK
jgi:hypothetical protein